MLITVTENAQNHFRALLIEEARKEEIPGLKLNLRIYASNPGTNHAEIGMTYCPQGDEEENDIAMNLGDFNLYIDKESEEALQEAKIDYIDSAEKGEGEEGGTSGGGGQLSIKAPYLKGRVPPNDSPLGDRVRYVLDSDINPMLAGHGGRVSLVDIIDDQIVVLQFGGGCHGCGMAGATMKNGIEKTLKEKFPEITEVRDATDHALGENPYY
jgi:Fe/S biogenesis protein NfuA